jgi:HEAT repeat protein
VGDFSAVEVAAPERAAKIPIQSGRARDRTRERDSRNTQRDPIAEAERLERLERRREENLSRIDDDDPAIRADAVEGLRADDETIPVLTDLAMNDPDADVRKVVVSALSDSSQEDNAARGALLGALSDPDPQVVIAALDSIEWIGDASMIPEITPLLQHPNAEVRGAAEDTIGFIE